MPAGNLLGILCVSVSEPERTNLAEGYRGLLSLQNSKIMPLVRYIERFRHNSVQYAEQNYL